MDFSDFNRKPATSLTPLLQTCCGSDQWVLQIIENRPYTSLDNLLESSTLIWNSLSRKDWLQAFNQHPQIGDLESLKAKYSSTFSLAAAEQSGTALASEQVLTQLSEYNHRYLQKFGYIFIVFATGKSAGEMLHELKQRINNPADEEILVAASEQIKITNLRLKKLIP